MTALAGNHFLNMPFIGQTYENLQMCNNDFSSVDYEYYQKQPLQLQVPPQPPQQPQEPYAMFPMSPMSGSTSPLQSVLVPVSGSTSPVSNMLYSHNSSPVAQYNNINNNEGLNDNNNNNDNNDGNNVQIKSEFDPGFEDFNSGIHLIETVSSAESSPHIVASNEFENSQFNYSYNPGLCGGDDSSSETLSSATSPIGAEFTYENSFDRYLDLFTANSSAAIEPQSFTDQMRFIIYEPRPMSDNVPPLVPNVNNNNMNNNININNIEAHNTYTMQPMWSLPIQNNNIDNRIISSRTTQGQGNIGGGGNIGNINPISFDYTQNQVLVVNPEQINPLPSTTITNTNNNNNNNNVNNSSSSTTTPPPSSQSPQPVQSQSNQQQQQQQQLIKCPHEDCPKTFSRLYNLKAHLRSHSPARPYQCPMCPRSFSRKHDLQRHIRVHTGVKPYQCPCCRKAFARTDALRRHFKMEETCRNSPEVQNMKTRRRYSDLH